MTMPQSEIEFEEGWRFVEAGIAKLENILEGIPGLQFSSEEYMMLYTMIYNMSMQDPHEYSERLYQKYKGAFISYIYRTVLPSLKEKHHEFLLRELVKRWNNHKVMVKWLSRFFHYLDRHFTMRNKLASLKDAGMVCFRESVYENLRYQVRDEVIALINREREGEQIDKALLKNVLDLYVEMGMGVMDYYKNHFEDAMLKDTASYYSRKASNWILKAEESLKMEMARFSHYLHASGRAKLFKIVHDELLVAYTSQLLLDEHSGYRVLLKDDKVHDLNRMYRLFRTVRKASGPLLYMFKQHVTSEGMILVQQAEDAANSKAEHAGAGPEQTFVKKVIELHDKYHGFLAYCFNNHIWFHKVLKDAFEVFFNKSVAGSSSAELLASYCDNILEKSRSEKLSDEAVEVTLDKVVKLLAYISDKDLFAEFCRKKLSRRLLFDKSANDDHERLILTKLKEKCGRHVTSKMEGMVNDLTLAKENQKHFRKYLSNNPAVSPGLELTVTVLTTGFWPSYKSSDMSLPAEMLKYIEVFREFYQTKTKNRKLSWIHSLGTCNINAKFEQKPIELILGTYQAAVLLLFNASDRLGYSDIKIQLKLEDEDLVIVLHSLSCGKYEILTKEPNTRSVSPNDYFGFNSKFTYRKRKIRIPLPPVDERKKVVEDVNKDRRYEIDACIMRIMKSRKVLGHEQLVMECIEQMSCMFKPDFKAVKKRMEDLIARDYLERDKKDPNLFKYIA